MAVAVKKKSPTKISKPAEARRAKPIGNLWPAAVIIALAVVAYANSLHGKFVFDDQQIVLQNPILINIHTLHDVVSQGAGWRQLLFLTYGFNYYWSGLDTFSYHVLNVALHAINSLLVFGIIWSAMRPSPGPLPGGEGFFAFAGAAVFSVHTLFTSAVSYIAGRSSVLCATFYFAAILLFFLALDAKKIQTRVIYLALTAISGLLAWQAKQEAITLPLFLAGVLFLRSEKKDWRWIAPLAAIPGVIVLLIREQLASLYSIVMGNQVLVSAGFEKVLQPTTYFRTYLTSVVGYYLPRFAFPINLSADPQITAVEHWYSPEFIVSIATLAGLTWLTLRFYKREPLFGLGVAALFVSPLMAYAAIPLADVVLEHRTYIPGLGIAFLFAWAFQVMSRRSPAARWPALIALAVVLTAMTISRNNVWANNIALWEDAESKAPRKPRPHFNLGQAYQEGQRLPEAIREYQHALTLKADIHAAYSNMAAIYLDQKQYDKGEETLLKVTSLAPDFTEGFINLGVLHIRRQDPDKAIPPLKRAIELNGESFAAHFNMGEALTQKGDFKAALESYKTAVHLRPDIKSFRLTLGVAYSRVGDRASAEKEFLELTNTPVAAEAYRNLGVMRSDAGEPDRAIEYLQQATRMKNVYPEAHHDLGVVYLRKQMTNEAIEQFRTTLAQQPDFAPAVLNLALSYQMNGDVAVAKQTLQAYVNRYGNANSPYLGQVRERLAVLR